MKAAGAIEWAENYFTVHCVIYADLIGLHNYIYMNAPQNIMKKTFYNSIISR